MVKEMRFPMQQISSAPFLLNRSSFLLRCALSLITAAILGCGGGTTGTSSTGELKLIGEARGPNDRPAAYRNMIVYSGGDLSQEELAVSATDSNGRFDMSLPGSESSVSVAVEGGARLNIRRKFSGSSVVSTLLVDTTDINKSAINRDICVDGSDGCAYSSDQNKLFFLRYSYEVYIDPNDICARLGTENNSVLVREVLADTPCEVVIAAYSEQIPSSRFIAKLLGKCNGNERTLLEVAASSDGEMRVDLSQLVRERCEPTGRIEVAPTEIAGVRVSIPVK